MQPGLLRLQGSNWGFSVPEEQRAFARALVDQAHIDVVHGHSSHHIKARAAVLAASFLPLRCLPVSPAVTIHVSVQGCERWHGKLICYGARCRCFQQAGACTSCQTAVLPSSMLQPCRPASMTVLTGCGDLISDYEGIHVRQAREASAPGTILPFCQHLRHVVMD